MASKTAPHVTLAEFYQNEERFIQEKREQLERMYIQRVENTLEQFRFRPSTAKSIAEKVIRKGSTYKPNILPSEDETIQVNAITDEFKQILDVAVLFIQAPLEDKDKNRLLQYDAKSRDLQYKSFIKRHPSLNKENQKVHTEEKKVYDYEEMKKEILHFIKKHASRAIIASFFFNGHGTVNGNICFQKNEAPLTTVIQDLKEVVKTNQSDSKSQLPGSVEMIFCQCYSYLCGQLPSRDLEVYTFTDEHYELTYVTETCDKLTLELLEAVHEELEADVPKSQKRWDKKLAEGKKMIPEVDGGPTTSVMEGLPENVAELEISGMDKLAMKKLAK